MPHYSPSLPFRPGRAGCSCVLASLHGRPVNGSRTCRLASMPRPALRFTAAYVPGTGARSCKLASEPAPAAWCAPSNPLGCDSPMLLASLCSPFSGVFPFLDGHISLARNIRCETIKPMTKYCPVFMLSLADMQ